MQYAGPYLASDSFLQLHTWKMAPAAVIWKAPNAESRAIVREQVMGSGRIHMHAFEISLGILTGIAILCFIARMAIRLRYQRKLHLDDAFLILAVACLCVATGIIYRVSYFLYLHSAALLLPEITPFLIEDLGELLKLQNKVYPYLAMIWTATFAVKWCFLAFMRPLIGPMARKLKWYFWFIVGFCTIVWAFLVAEPFIICPYFGVDALKCFYSTVDADKTLALTTFVTILDVLSDIMIVSLPIIILKGSQLSRSTKFGLAVFLCLSIFMAICAITRVSGFHYRGIEDDTWNFYWQHAEGATAVMMASLTAFRTLFVKPSNDPDATTPRSPVESFFHKISRRFRSLARATPEPTEKPISTSTKKSIFGLPKIPSATFSGVRTFIRRNNRSEVDRTLPTFNTVDSDLDAFEVDYHAALKQDRHASSAPMSSRGTSHKSTSQGGSVSSI